MKKNILLLLGLLLTLTFAMTSCKDDDDPKPDPIEDEVIELLKKGEMKGTLTEDYQLDASKTYNLTGSFVIEDGTTLTIPAGTQIKAMKEDGNETNVYIAVMMGGKIDIQGTASAPVIMTSQNAQPGDWGGLTLCGKAETTAGVNATAEVGNFKYGGSDNADNSGTIKYLVIKGTGASIKADSEYNGVTFYAVGSGTVVENIAVINGADDGVEFFGGTVNAKNLYLENNEDDAIDWTEGWSGTVENAYVKHTIPNFSTVVEGDKVNNNPKLINLTAVSTTGGTALQFKKQSGATITGLSLTGYDKNIDMKDNGSLDNVKIDGASADVDAAYDAPATVDPSSWSWADAQIVEIEELAGEITSDKALDASKLYKLKGACIVNDGAKLTIPAGTRIIAEPQDGDETNVYIAVLMGGMIDIQGTMDNPVIMTSNSAQPGDWGGLTLCGKATTTAGENATAEVGNFKYGGSDDEDNSGSVKNLVIKGTGASIKADSEYNGVTCYAVGSKTTLENIAIINGADDGIEFFGGTVSAKNLYLENNEDDAIDWTEGWSGKVENAYVKHTIENFSTVVEGDKLNNNPQLVNLTAISTTGGTALQFKKQSGATITNLYLEGYDKNIDMKDNGPLSNVKIDGVDADPDADYTTGTKVDISEWNFIK